MLTYMFIVSLTYLCYNSSLRSHMLTYMFIVSLT